jgi:hypothetical protein
MVGFLGRIKTDLHVASVPVMKVKTGDLSMSNALAE